MIYTGTASSDTITFSPGPQQIPCLSVKEGKEYTTSNITDYFDVLYINTITPDITREARERILTFSNKTLCEEALQILAAIRHEIAKNRILGHLPKIYVFESEDGSILLEWIFKNLRLGLSIESEIEKSSWFLVSNKSIGSINAYGRLDSDIKYPVIKWLANLVISNPSLFINDFS